MAEKEGEQPQGQNLIGATLDLLNQARETLKLYEAIPTGAFGASMIRQVIKRSEAAIASGDVVELLMCYKELQEIE